jgi:hypothetical protein
MPFSSQAVLNWGIRRVGGQKETDAVATFVTHYLSEEENTHKIGVSPLCFPNHGDTLKTQTY